MRPLLIAITIIYFFSACGGAADTSPANTLERMRDKDSLVILMKTRSCSSDALSKLIIHKEKETCIADYYKLHEMSVRGGNVDNGPAGKLTQTKKLDSTDRVVFKRFVRDLVNMTPPSCTIFTVYTITSPYWNTEVTVDECFRNDLDDLYITFFGENKTLARRQ
jgi:hypothetical protein